MLLLGKFTISMAIVAINGKIWENSLFLWPLAIVNSYVKLPEGNQNILSTGHPGLVENPEEKISLLSHSYSY